MTAIDKFKLFLSEEIDRGCQPVVAILGSHDFEELAGEVIMELIEHRTTQSDVETLEVGGIRVFKESQSSRGFHFGSCEKVPI